MKNVVENFFFFFFFETKLAPNGSVLPVSCDILESEIETWLPLACVAGFFLA